VVFGWFLGGFWVVFGWFLGGFERFSCIENETLPLFIYLFYYLLIKEVFSVIQKSMKNLGKSSSRFWNLDIVWNVHFSIGEGSFCKKFVVTDVVTIIYFV